MYESTFGVWEVTTEGDCEGRTSKTLGTFEGHVDDIAFKLSKQATYGLEFKPVSPPEKVEAYVGPVTEVNVRLDIKSGLWNVANSTLVSAYKVFFSSGKRDINIVSEGNSFASVKLTSPKPITTPEQDLEEAKAAARKALTPEQLKILGL